MNDTALIAFAQLLEHAHKLRQQHAERQEGERQRDLCKAATDHLSDDELKAAWDRYDGSNQEGDPSGEDIHWALNMRGHGRYCAV